MTNEQNSNPLNQNEFILSLLNSTDGKNIILEAMKLAGADPNADNFDENQLKEFAAMDIDALRELVLNNPALEEKIIHFIRSTGLGLFHSPIDPNLSSSQLTKEQVLQTILENPSALQNLFQLTQMLGIDKDAALEQVTQLQEALHLFKQLAPEEEK
ncbi:MULTISPECIES: hypothetical protein [unclassified Bacillus cereus group]|uniref:hypothetical protein n=1 Tax=unclassified Bacillus cereus group TaxID=2750818 RepID=UPI001F59D1DF|nr:MULTISPECIES: hypothetical protein [unclassified Bacillus cereus group]